MHIQHTSQLLMSRDSLDDLPELNLPDPYHVHGMAPGHEAAWEHIITASFGGEHDFRTDMAADDYYKAENVWFIADGQGTPVATASAWYRSQWPADTGYLHMVGLLPEYAGKRLGYYASLAALLQMKREGRTRAVLHTDDYRVPAVRTYLNLGFSAQLADDSHLGRWQALASQLNRSIEAVDDDGAKIVIVP